MLKAPALNKSAPAVSYNPHPSLDGIDRHKQLKMSEKMAKLDGEQLRFSFGLPAGSTLIIQGGHQINGEYGSQIYSAGE